MTLPRKWSDAKWNICICYHPQTPNTVITYEPMSPLPRTCLIPQIPSPRNIILLMVLLHMNQYWDAKEKLFGLPLSVRRLYTLNLAQLFTIFLSPASHDLLIHHLGQLKNCLYPWLSQLLGGAKIITKKLPYTTRGQCGAYSASATCSGLDTTAFPQANWFAIKFHFCLTTQLITRPFL